MRTITWASLALFTVLLSACTVAPAAPTAAAPPASLKAPASTQMRPEAATATTVPAAEPALLPPEPPPGGAAREFKTDFSRHTVPYTEILSGGPPKDGIPAIDSPQFVTVAEANSWLKDVEPVILVQVGADARAYPLQILMWHEIVNDTVGGVPLAVTFCPLCNTAIAFERTLDGRVLDFGTTGRLRFSNLIMYDRQTESWWQQAEGDAIAGELAGRRLAFYPATIVSWAEFRKAHPDGKVLSRETGYTRDYGSNPYVGYDDVNQPPFLYQGPPTPGKLPPMARVLTVDLNGETVAYPYNVLAEVRVVNDMVGGRPVAVFWAGGVASALDNSTIALGREVGAAAAFSPELDGRRLIFRAEGKRIVDAETGSEWDVLGRAVKGELAGRQLAPIVSVNHFWFSWAAFKPETRIYQP
jgi:hypothetical protein